MQHVVIRDFSDLISALDPVEARRIGNKNAPGRDCQRALLLCYIQASFGCSTKTRHKKLAKMIIVHEIVNVSRHSVPFFIKRNAVPPSEVASGSVSGPVDIMKYTPWGYVSRTSGLPVTSRARFSRTLFSAYFFVQRVII